MATGAEKDKSSEKDWIIALRNGDQQAFAHLYTRYRASLYAFALTDLKIPSLAEDAVQEVFIKLWTHRRKLDERHSIKSFLFTCLKNRVLNMIRTHRNQIVKHLAYQQSQPSSSNETEKTVAWSEHQQWISKGMSQLSEKRKQVIQLSLYQGLTPEEIAGELDLTIDTVKTYLKHSNRFLRAFLKKNLHA